MNPNDKDSQDNVNYELCKACRGKCCSNIYTDTNSVEFWDNEFEEAGSLGAGVEPVFNPHLVHNKNREYLKEFMEMRGFNPYACQFLDQDGDKGCLLPRDRRPQTCKSYRCKKWDSFDASNAFDAFLDKLDKLDNE